MAWAISPDFFFFFFFAFSFLLPFLFLSFYFLFFFFLRAIIPSPGVSFMPRWHWHRRAFSSIANRFISGHPAFLTGLAAVAIHRLGGSLRVTE